MYRLATMSEKWYFFCEDETVVSFSGLLEVLARYSSEEVMYNL